jgi:hypothetical protein
MNRYEDISLFGIFWRVCLVAIGLAILWVGIMGGVFGLRVGLAEYIGRGEARIEIQSGASRIANYEHFFNLCASVQADEASIDAQTAAMQTAITTEDQQRFRQNLAALQANRARSIYQYNADAMKDYTSGQFRDSALPYQIPATDYQAGDVRTSCG